MTDIEAAFETVRGLLQSDDVTAGDIKNAQRALTLIEQTLRERIEKRDALHRDLDEARRTLYDLWRAKANDLAEERDALRSEVREWLCERCNTVYPGPPQHGASCVVCPRCGGDTGPRESILRRRLGAALRECREALRECREALREATDNTSLSCQEVDALLRDALIHSTSEGRNER